MSKVGGSIPSTRIMPTIITFIIFATILFVCLFSFFYLLYCFWNMFWGIAGGTKIARPGHLLDGEPPNELQSKFQSQRMSQEEMQRLLKEVQN